MLNRKSHILAIDDDSRLRSLLQKFLRDSGFHVSVAQNADEARSKISQYNFDLLIVDIMMPGETGIELTKSIRNESNIPIIMLTAMGETENRIEGLETGADDYLPKPFEPKELILRIKNILKRIPEKEDDKTKILNLGICNYNPAKKELTDKHGNRIHLTPAEETLLMILAEKPGQIFSREKLSDLLDGGQNPRSIDVQITRLRKKIEIDSKNPRYLQTVRGKGYIVLPE